MWVKGQNSVGQLGDGTTTSKEVFSMVRTVPGANAVAASTYHSMLLTHEGGVWVTGWNKYGQLGDRLREDRKAFFQVMQDGVRAVAVAAGDMHSMVLKVDGSVWATGRNQYGQLGDGSNADRSEFVEVISSEVTEVAAGGFHSMVLKQDGSVWATGWNEYGQLGDGTTTDRSNYVQVVSSQAKTVMTNNRHSMILKQNGQLRDGSHVHKTSYVRVVGGAKAVVTGRRHSMILKHDGSVWSAGCNVYGQLGNNSTAPSVYFVRVISEGARVVGAGAFHSMVLKEDGSIWAAGLNNDGQFGDGTTISRKAFVRLDTFIKLPPFSNGAGE